MSSQAAGVRPPDGMRLRRYLPLSLTVTLGVTLLPLFAVSQLGPARGPFAVAVHVVAAVVLSIIVARILAALWTRHERSSDLVFGDLLLWGWVRRVLAERRLDLTARQLVAPASQGDDRVVLLRRISTLLETRDPYTHGHSRRVARHAERTARAMGLTSDQVKTIRAAAMVHDIGKINVPRPILTKPGKLSDEEFALVKRHPRDGAAIVADLGDAQLTAIVRHHHERMDGNGYPDGLAGNDIPVGARVIAVADTFDAITSARSYRKTRTHKQAIDVLQREAGTQLDPVAVAAFVSYYAAKRSVGFATVLAAAPQRLVTGLGGVQSGLAASVAPITQTACGVGGIALVGACLGGPVLPASSTEADATRPTPERQFASQTSRAADGDHGPGAADQHERPRKHSPRPRAEVGDSETTTVPGERVAPRALQVPDGGSPTGGGGQTNSGSGGGSSGAGTDAPPDVQTVLEPVLEPVTDLELPQLQTPLPAPQISLP